MSESDTARRTRVTKVNANRNRKGRKTYISIYPIGYCCWRKLCLSVLFAGVPTRKMYAIERNTWRIYVVNAQDGATVSPINAILHLTKYSQLSSKAEFRLRPLFSILRWMYIINWAPYYNLFLEMRLAPKRHRRHVIIWNIQQQNSSLINDFQLNFFYNLW